MYKRYRSTMNSLGKHRWGCARRGWSPPPALDTAQRYNVLVGRVGARTALGRAAAAHAVPATAVALATGSIRRISD